MGAEDCGQKLFLPADQLFTWAIYRDLQRSLKMIEGFQRELETILKGAEEDSGDTTDVSQRESTEARSKTI